MNRLGNIGQWSPNKEVTEIDVDALGDKVMPENGTYMIVDRDLETDTLACMDYEALKRGERPDEVIFSSVSRLKLAAESHGIKLSYNAGDLLEVQRVGGETFHLDNMMPVPGTDEWEPYAAVLKRVFNDPENKTLSRIHADKIAAAGMRMMPGLTGWIGVGGKALEDLPRIVKDTDGNLLGADVEALRRIVRTGKPEKMLAITVKR